MLVGFNDLATYYPELVREWSDLNYPNKPEDFTKRSTYHAWWKCSACGYLWEARIADRAEGHGCPVCAGEKLAPEINSLAAVKPELAEEWCSRNTKKPDAVWPRSGEMAWWKCKTCGFEWRALIRDRFNGKKCPACADMRVHPEFNSLAAREPWILKEWDYEANEKLLPTQILHNSMRPVWWKDEKGHRWKAKISDRLQGAGCPKCERKRREERQFEMLKDYAEKVGLQYELDDESAIGLPLQIFFPEIPGVIEIARGNHMQSRSLEYAMNWVCLNAGIRMIRILRPNDKEYGNCSCITREDDSDETLRIAITEAFRLLGVEKSLK